jgi:hypothetical protein
MVEWSEDDMAAIGSYTQHFDLVDRTWSNWRPGGALRLKVETAGWEGQGVVCSKSTAPRL